MNETLGNLVALTLQHGQYEIRRTTDPQECRDLVNDWAPHLAFIDLDLYEPFIDIVGRHFKQPKEGLGYDNSSSAHMWRTLAFPDRSL